MKKKSAGKVILKIFLGLIIAVIVAAVAAYAVIKYYVVPQYTEKLSKSGRAEIAELIEDNADMFAGLAPSNFCYSNIVGGYGIFGGVSIVETDWITPEFIEKNR